MKKSILQNTLKTSIAIVICLLFGQVGFSQITIFSENFDGISGPTAGGAGTYNFPTGWMLVNVDNRVPAGPVAYVNDAWERREDFAYNVGDSAAFSTSWYSPVGSADDWMWTPPITLGGTPTLSWNAIAYDPLFPDGYEVRIMVAPNVPSGTTGSLGNMVSNSTLLATISAENSTWTPRSVNLAAYTGQTVRIAFRNNSNDQFLLLIDDILIESPCIDPFITCGGPLNVNNDLGTCFATITNGQLLAQITTSGGFPNPTITFSPAAGLFPIGTTTVTATASNVCGTDATCTFDVIVSDIDAPEFTCAAQLLHDNGPLVNSVGTGFGGADESMLQSTSLGMGIIGFGHQVSANNRVADDFTITNPNGWTIDQISFYAYQTGSTTTSTINAVNLRIWDGVPGVGTVVYGDGATNLLVHSEWSGVYRVTETTSGATSRPIMKNTIDLGGLTLPAGTYWLDWQTGGTLGSGPWAPAVTITGQSTTGNALQSLAGGAFAAVTDIGGQDFPFIIVGSEVVENDLGVCEAFVTIESPLVLNECSGYTVTNDWNNTSDASDNYPVGTTTVTWTITDAGNNVSTCSFDITVEDTEAPSIDCNVIGGGTSTVASTNVPVAIPDNPAVTSTLTFPSAGTITDINVLNLQGTHTWVNDLEISLTSPGGTTVTLLNNSCGSNDNFNLNFDDAGAAHGTITCGTPMGAGGTYQPFQALSLFNGENPNGVWTLTIDDQAAGDIGSLTAWSLQITTAPGNTVLASNDAGECQAVVTVPAPTFGDNCSGSTILNNFNNSADASGTYPVGTTTVVWTVTDAAGLTNTCSMSVVVEDTEDPTVTCPGDIAVNNDAGDCGATVTFAATSTDNCPGETITYSPASGSFFPVGTTVVTATATDGAGNTATCTFNVTVSDTEIPSLVCPANIVQSNDPGQCDAVVTYTAPVGVDNCEPVVTQSLSQSITPGNSVSCNAGGLHADNSYLRVFDLPALGYTNDFYINSVDIGIETAVGAGGSQPATLNLYSLSGPLNYANMTLLATQAVTVADQTLSILNIPLTNQLTVPAGTVLVVEFFTPDGQGAGNSFFMGSNGLGQIGTSYITAAACMVTQPTSTVTIGFPSSQWVINVNAGTLTEQTAGLGSGATYPVGTTTESYQSTDVYGNVATCSFTVTVNDTENPVIDCTTSPLVCNTYASTDVPVNLPEGGGTSGPATSEIIVGTAGTISDINVLNLAGTHTWSSDLQFVLTSPGGTSVILVNQLCGSADNFNINLDDAGLPYGSIPCGPIGQGGTYQPFQSLSAFNNENAQGTWTLTINDLFGGDQGVLNSWSLAICTGGGTSIFASADPGVCETVVTVPQPTFSDNCSGAVISNDYNNSADATDTYPVGVHTVLWTAVDLAGNSSTCTMVITVTDDEAPLIDCPDDIAVNNDLGQCGAVVTFDAPLFSDNCPLPALVPFTSNTSVSIPDNDPLGVSTTQDVSGLNGTNLGTDVFLQSVCLEVAHTWVEDLIVVLTSPNGDQITLVDQPLCSGDNLDVCFVPGTGSSINTTGSCGSSPAYSGTFTAEYGDLGSLSTGTDPNGVWTLSVSDNFAFDIGNISSWTLTFLDVNGTAQAIQVAGLPSGSLFPVGTTTNIFEITDGAGNTATCSFDVTVSDVEGPVLSCPDVTVDNDPGLCSAVVNYTEPVGVDNCEPYQLTQSLSQSITTFNSVSCNAGGLHTNNSYMRVFDLGALGFSDFYINSVDVGIEQAVGNGGSQPATLNLYSLTGPLTFANLTLLASEAVTVADQTSTVLNIPLSSQLTVPAGTVLVVEFFTPDGQGAGNSLFIGSNAAGQTGDTYLAAADCGVAQPTNVADIGFPGMHWVLNVNAGSLTEFVSGIGTGGTFPVGSTTETYQSTDIYGNVSTCSFDVTVEDVEAPVFTFCPTDITGCEADVNTNYADPTATDNCSVIITQTSGLPSGPFPPGITVNTFVAEDPAGNTATCTFTYTIYPNPVVDFTYFPTCIGEIVYFTANVSLNPALGANIVSYEWQFSDGSGINTDVNPTHVYNAAGDYDVTLTVTTNHGCVTSQTYTVTIHPTPEFTTTVEDANCFGESNGSITVDVTVGDAPISYSINGGPGQSSNSFSGLAAGNYLIAITDVNGCSQSATVTVGQPAALVGSVVSTTEALCFGQASGGAEVTATGGTAPYSYSIDGGASQASGVFSGLTGGAHIVIVTDDNGCTTTVSVTVGEPAQLVVSAASQPVLCFGDATGSIEVTATGGTGAYEYSADGGANFQSGGSFTGLSADSYVVVVQDENGCSVSEGVVITQPSAALAATGVVQNVACTGDASGSVVVTATGGTGAYSYSSDGGNTTQSSNVFTGLAAGDYTITVTDANGCTSTVDVTVAEPVELLTATTTATPVSCNGQGDGQISVAVTGGDAPYEYSFNGGITWQSSNSFSDLAPGTYTVLVNDANGCQVASIVVVTQPAALTVVQSASTNSSCEGQNNGSFTVTAAGGTSPYTYTSGGNSNSTGVFSNVSSGTHLVTVTDASGCSASIQVTVGYTNPLPDAAFSWFAAGTTVQFSNQSTNGTSYSWNFGDGNTSTSQNPVHTYAASGTYTVTLIVTNACGSDTITWVIDTNSIGINDPNADASVLNIYPNPNHGQFTLNYTSTGIIGDIQVNVMTIEGKLLMAEQFTVNADTFVRNYSDIELAAGMYIIQFVSQNGTEVKRITVDK